MRTPDALKKEFIELVKKDIHRDGIDNLLDALEKTDFYKSPASTKYHGSYPGGLVDHSINVYYSLLDFMTFIYGPDWTQRYSQESIAIISLFHDLCKIGRYKSGFRNVKNKETGAWEEKQVYEYNPEYGTMGHGSKSVYMIMKYMQLTEEEAAAIYWHMGPYDLGNYNTVGDLGNCWNHNTLGYALFSADMHSTYIVENEFFEPMPLQNTENENNVSVQMDK